MRLCLVTTFFGPEGFGGDAAIVERLAGALARRGHDVHVAHSADAFEAVRNGEPLRTYSPPPGVTLHTFRSRIGVGGPLWTHQTSHAGADGPRLRRLIGDGFDAVHFHNISLLGGLQVLAERGWTPGAARLLSAHDYWLVCQMSVLWKLDREPCETRSCLRCSLQGRRPPQAWRRGAGRDRALAGVDAVLVPSEFSRESHVQRGVTQPLVTLPYFLPDGWGAPRKGHRPAPPERPYFVAAGRLVPLKGFARLVGLMRELPAADLLIAGAGREEGELRRLAEGLPNVRLLGLVGEPELTDLFRGARAAIVPSLGWETFGFVALEAFSTGTPAIVSDRGALPEVAQESGGALVCGDDRELLEAMRRLLDDDELRARLGAAGKEAVATTYSEQVHVDRYLGLVEEIRARR